VRWALAHSRSVQRQQQANRSEAGLSPSALTNTLLVSHSWEPFGKKSSALPSGSRISCLGLVFGCFVFGFAPSRPVTASTTVSDSNGQRETRGSPDADRARPQPSVGGVDSRNAHSHTPPAPKDTVSEYSILARLLSCRVASLVCISVLSGFLLHFLQEHKVHETAPALPERLRLHYLSNFLFANKSLARSPKSIL
jgi:hypothetical protein